VPNRPIVSATLKVYSTTTTTTGYTVKAVSSTTWVEGSINYNNAPAIGATVTTVGGTTNGQYSSANVTSAVTTRGLISFGITDPTTTPITFQSNQGTNKPQLVVVAIPTDSTAPSMPTNLTATVKSGSEIDLAWTGSTDNVAVSGYNIYRDGTKIATVGSTSWFDTGLAAGSNHAYQIGARDAAGNESARVSVTKTTLNVATPDATAPTTPTNVTASSSAWNSATISWTASTDIVAVTSYTITRGTAVVGKVNGSATSFTDFTTAPGTDYTYTVTASDAAGNTSTPSSGAPVTTPAVTPPPDTQKPTVPTGLTATAGPIEEIDLAWTASTDTGGHVAGYNVSRDGTPIATTYSPTYKDTALAAGPHTYTITGFDGANNTSDPSSGATATAAAGLPGAVVYTYDLADRLISIAAPSGSTTTFTLDALGRHASQTITGSPVSTYAYLGTTDIVVKISSNSTTTLSAIDALGSRVATSSGASFGYLLGDLHGNQAAAFNAAGTAVSDAFAYDAWGVVVASVTSALPTPWRYQGRMLESAAGTPDLYDFAARSYNPALGTFTSLDSHLGSAQNTALLNGYLYANANPATLVDPDGHCASSDGWNGCNQNSSPIVSSGDMSRDVYNSQNHGGSPDDWNRLAGDQRAAAAAATARTASVGPRSIHSSDSTTLGILSGTGAKEQVGCDPNPLASNSCEGQLVGGASALVGAGQDLYTKARDITVENLDKAYKKMGEWGPKDIGKTVSDETAGLTKAAKYLIVIGFAIQTYGVVHTYFTDGPGAALREAGIDVVSDVAASVAGGVCEIAVVPADAETIGLSAVACIGVAAGTGVAVDAAMHNVLDPKQPKEGAAPLLPGTGPGRR
jgi:RHS repeat-associated protein